MEDQRRDVLNFNNVEMVVAREGNVVWQYMAGIDYKSLGYRGFEQAQRPGFQLVLFAIARARYFLGGPRAPIRNPRLREKDSLAAGLGFTVGEGEEAVEKTMDQLLVGQERIALKEWLVARARARSGSKRPLRFPAAHPTLGAEPAYRAGRLDAG